MPRQVSCPYCYTTFTTTNKDRRYCSDRCYRLAKTDRQRLRYYQLKEQGVRDHPGRRKVKDGVLHSD